MSSFSHTYTPHLPFPLNLLVARTGPARSHHTILLRHIHNVVEKFSLSLNLLFSISEGKHTFTLAMIVVSKWSGWQKLPKRFDPLFQLGKTVSPRVVGNDEWPSGGRFRIWIMHFVKYSGGEYFIYNWVVSIFLGKNFRSWTSSLLMEQSNTTLGRVPTLKHCWVKGQTRKWIIFLSPVHMSKWWKSAYMNSK